MSETNYKCGYCGWLINTHCDNYMEHVCFQKRMLRDVEVQLVADENNILTISNASNLKENNSDGTSHSQTNHLQTMEELLIAEVYKRPPLWDHTAPRCDRYQAKIKDLWHEIYNTLDSQYPIELLKKKWRQLRDEYVRAKKKEKKYIPSGSGAEALPPRSGFKYFDVMKFLDDVVEYSTESNIELSPSNIEQHQTPTSSASESTSTMSKRKKNDKSELQYALLETIRETERQPDGVDGFLLLAGVGLRRLPYRSRARLQLKILQMINDEEERINTNENDT